MSGFNYPWDQAPEWANWAAVDADRNAYWYSMKPIFSGGFWNIPREHGSCRQMMGAFASSCRATAEDSLQAKPKPPSKADAALEALKAADYDSLAKADPKTLRALAVLCKTTSEICDYFLGEWE